MQVTTLLTRSSATPACCIQPPVQQAGHAASPCPIKRVRLPVAPALMGSSAGAMGTISQRRVLGSGLVLRPLTLRSLSPDRPHHQTAAALRCASSKCSGFLTGMACAKLPSDADIKPRLCGCTTARTILLISVCAA